MEEFSGKRERYITWQDMNKHLSYIKRNHYLIRYDKHLRGESLYLTAYIEDKPVYFRLTYKVGSYVCTYIVRKDEKPVMDQVSGTQAFQLLSRYYKVPRVDKRFCGRADEGGMSAAPFLYCNPKYEKQWLFAYGYDLNKAYA